MSIGVEVNKRLWAQASETKRLSHCHDVVVGGGSGGGGGHLNLLR